MDHTAALVEQNDLLAALLLAADPSTPVPTCPDWTLRKLAAHVGRGHRWAGMIAQSGAFVDPRAVPDGAPPADPAAAQAWLRHSATMLLDAVTAAGADTPVWTFLGPKPAAWWIRRRLHEATVHRADATLAVGEPYALAPELGADGISEWLDLVAARPAGDTPPLGAGVTLHLHATDDDLGADGEWMIRGGDGVVSWEHGHGKGDAAVRGPAADLLLAVTRRLPAPQVIGEQDVWSTWLERTGF